MHETYDLDLLLELVDQKQFRRLKELLAEMNEVDIAEFMDEVEDPEEELVETPEYPSNLDPVLREGLHIVKDMIDLR